MSALAEMILEQSASQPEGSVLTAKEFLHLGKRAAVDQALCRLARAGQLLRIARGQYIRPLSSRFGAYLPTPERVVEGVAAVTGETIVPSGAVAANRLGLSSQVPVRPVFLTSGRTRRLRLGKQAVELRHAPAWQLREPHSPFWAGSARIGMARPRACPECGSSPEGAPPCLGDRGRSRLACRATDVAR
jgi:hypothetical protein